jgi:geranylgeranyl diphosphate synthase type II
VIVLLSCELFSRNPGKAMPQALAIELFHNFTLIHDDIMDHAPLRRGLPTVHEKFNTPVAILSGDVMLVYAYKYLLNTELSLIPELMELFNDCAVKVCEGQQLDMNLNPSKILLPGNTWK